MKIELFSMKVLLYGKITRLPRPDFCPHVARRRSHLHSRKRDFLITFGWTRNPRIYDPYSPIGSRSTFFARSRKKFKKSIPSVWMAPKWITFSRPSFVFIFQEICKAMAGARFLRGRKRFKKVIKIMHFDVLQGPFVDLEQASRQISKIVQNDGKMQLKSPQNDHEKTCAPFLHAVA